VPFLESLNPGIVPEQHHGKLLVRKVVFNSPAQHAGVEVGDEILSINGRGPGAFACGAGWLGDDHVSTIVFRRGGQEVKLQMPSVSLVSMLSFPGIVPSSVEVREPFDLDAPFTFGFRWEERRGYLEISQILSGSPAYAAGFKIGDRIVSTSGGSSSGASALDVSQLRDGDMPKRINIETADGAVHRWVVLPSRAISEILASPAQPKPRPQIEQAGLNETPTAPRLR
jgi:C-terminal processing protease CtpA/Prc